MDIKTLLNNLHEEVSCSVCMITFTDPKMLPCLHSFCLHCLEGILRTSGRHDIITCPECRRESRVPGSGNLKDLPTNFRINSLLDVLAIQACSTTGVKCGNCDKKSSQSLYCFQCCAFWCDDCITGHNIIRANKDHRVLALKDFQDQDIEDVLKRPAFCGKPGHEKKELEFFCKTCEEPVCYSCAATIHGDGHIKILLEEAANESKAEAKTVIESQKEMAQKMRNKIFQIDQNCAKIRGEVANAKRRVQQFADNIFAVIETKKQEIIHEVENQGQQSLQRLEIQRNEIEHQAQKIETGIENTETLLKRSTNLEIAQLDKTLKTIFQEGVRLEGGQVDCDLEGLRQFIFVENETLLEKAITEGIGSFKTF
ncbi:E3 ubiquitin-protein ligase TRIM56-like, partial [Orbicella faveolata]|uniref:E3 ubiquitin-protein ligase TRIM56-like n=1 Tax=Orbicella faveolata TaxID=48498 RepID=UPI0009E479BF